MCFLELKYYFLTNKSELIHVHTWERGIGKSYNLVKLAVRFNLPIIVPNHSSKNHLMSLSRLFFKNNQLHIIVANDYSRGYKFKKLLVEEGISPDIMSNIVFPMAETVIGYKAIGY